MWTSGYLSLKEFVTKPVYVYKGLRSKKNTQRSNEDKVRVNENLLKSLFLLSSLAMRDEKEKGEENISRHTHFYLSFMKGGGNFKLQYLRS